MSADNWRVCPRCIRVEEAKKSKRKIKAEEAYGKVPVKEYLELVAKSKIPISANTTLREDYEIWMDEDGRFVVTYSGKCTDCDFEHKFVHRDQAVV